MTGYVDHRLWSGEFRLFNTWTIGFFDGWNPIWGDLSIGFLEDFNHWKLWTKNSGRSLSC